MTLAGVWKNEYGSTMTLNLASQNLLTGIYQSSTGSTGTYQVIGYQTNTDPTLSAGQPVSLAISWHSVAAGPPDNSWHWVSGLSGQISIVSGAEQLVLVHALVASIEFPGLVRAGTYIDKLTYRRLSAVATTTPNDQGSKVVRSGILGSWIAEDGTALFIESAPSDIADVFGSISGKLLWRGNLSVFQGVIDIEATSAGLTQQAVAIVGLPNEIQGPAISFAGTLDFSSGLLTLLDLESQSTAPGNTYVQTSVSSKVFSKN